MCKLQFIFTDLPPILLLEFQQNEKRLDSQGSTKIREINMCQNGSGCYALC
jgi:hypothetical protein